MWEFPNGRVDGDPVAGLSKALGTVYRLQVRVKEPLGLYRHAYTHFKVTVHAFRCKLLSKPDVVNLKWVSLKELQEYPMGRIDRRIADEVRRRIHT
jgi:A/G-specific adenine glycosylase